jgi:dephospho-CoA kinase
MKKIALTGGIGSGKSTVARVFETFAFPVFVSDISAHSLLFDLEVKNIVCEHFGKNILDYYGEVDTQALADIIFNNSDELLWYNKLIHPLVMKDFDDFCKNQNSDIVIFESAIIFENNLEKYFDKIISVYCPQNIALQRLIERGMTKEDALRRMNLQLSPEKKADLADFVIKNDNSLSILQQVDSVMDTLNLLGF